MVDLSLLMPEFADKLREFIIEAQYQGLDVDIESGFRSSKEQDRLYSLGRTVVNQDGMSPAKPLGNIVTNAKGNQSWHNFGVAADVVFRKNGQWDWNAPAVDYQKLARIAQDYDLDWGGSWSGVGKTLGDLDHFQMVYGLTIQEATELQSIKDVWNEIQRRTTS